MSNGEALVEAFLIVDQPRQRLGHWSHALSALDDRAAPPLALVRAYYDPSTDQALINVAYDPFALGGDKLHYVVELALLVEVGMIQPHELTAGDRRRFLEERLARCSIKVDTQRNVISTLTELVRMIRESRAASGRTPVPSVAPGALTALAMIASPPIPMPMRGDTQDPVLLVKAKGTRDNVPPTVAVRGTRDRIALPPLARDIDPPTDPAPVIPLDVIARSHRAQTVEMPREEAVRLLSETMPPAPAGAIYARYLRSGRWVPIRIGALSLKGAALMAGALPRLNDNVDVALSFGGHRALVRGAVRKVSSLEEAQISGASSFSVAFELDDASRRQLTALLTAARAANITIKPAPPRTARRFPVEWVVSLGTTKGIVKAGALDVSRDGLFVRPTYALALTSTLNFSAVLDDGGPPVSGRARVVRQVAEAEARVQGLAAGFGLQVVEMGAADRHRWLAFIARVEKRAERRVLIGASPLRLGEIQAELVAAGYIVTGGSDPGALVQLASSGSRPVDAAIIDASWLSATTSAEWVESLFAARNVPCMTLQGDTKRARSAVDRLLIIS